MRVSDFDYDLPPELIAQHPLPDRAEARMLVVARRKGTIEHCRVADLATFLRAGDLLVVPNGFSMPAVLDRKTGKLLRYLQGYRRGHCRVAAAGTLPDAHLRRHPR